MILIGVQIDGVDTFGFLQKVIKDVVASAGDGENDVLLVDLKELTVDLGILPVESVDVLITELLMLGKEIVIVNAPMMLLVKGRRQGQVVTQIHNSRLVRLGARNTLIGIDGALLLELQGGEIRRLGQGCVQLLKGFLACLCESFSVTSASNEDVVWNATETTALVGTSKQCT